jgi:nitrate/TMAO reductase-like tetraheme cytochrome c subunit
MSSLERRQVALALSLSLLAWLWPGPGLAAAEAEDSCVACHSNPNFYVTNKKLYDYFQRWQESLHQQEGVTCVDCHGGNPKAPDKEGAHGAHLSESDASSAVNFRNIPRTCGECHEEIYRGFRTSEHFEKVVAEKQADQGPTCVSCHGSIDVAVLNVVTVEETCARCHNEVSDNHPENAREARGLLNRLLSIQRYYRYITVRGDPLETKEFFEKVDVQLRDLSVTWHTFDLAEIEKKTEIVLGSLRDKREKLAKAFKEKRQQESEAVE